MDMAAVTMSTRTPKNRQLSEDSPPEQILKAWGTHYAWAQSIIKAIGDAIKDAETSQKKLNITPSLEMLKTAQAELEKIYGMAEKKVDVADACCCCSYQNCLTRTSTIADAVGKLATVAFWGAKTYPIATAISNAASAGISKWKAWIWKREEELYVLLAQMEQIVSNRVGLDHIGAMVHVFEGYHVMADAQRKIPRVPNAYRDQFDEESLSRTVSGRAIVARKETPAASPGFQEEILPIVDEELLRGQYIRVVCGVNRMNRDAVVSLADEFEEIKGSIEKTIQAMGGSLKTDPTADLAVHISLLTSKLEELKTIFATAATIIRLHDEILHNRSACLAAGFRVGVEILFDICSLGSSIFQVVASEEGAEDQDKIYTAGLVIYIVGAAVSWLNTGISNVRVVDAMTYREANWISAQRGFAKNVGTMTDIFTRYQKLALRTDLSSKDIESAIKKFFVPACFRDTLGGKEAISERVAALALQKAPQIVDDSTRLGRKIRELSASVLGATLGRSAEEASFSHEPTAPSPNKKRYVQRAQSEEDLTLEESGTPPVSERRDSRHATPVGSKSSSEDERQLPRGNTGYGQLERHQHPALRREASGTATPESDGNE